MDGVRQYIISVTAAALIGGIAAGLVPKGTARELVRLLCGMLLAVSVIRPLTGVDLGEWMALSFPSPEEAEAAAAMGESMAARSRGEIIKEETEAYILDKAAALKANLTVEVTVSGSGTPVPTAAKYRGEVPADVRQQLETIVQTELGIARENQTWIG